MLFNRLDPANYRMTIVLKMMIQIELLVLKP